jgi:hypothetical protein
MALRPKTKEQLSEAGHEQILDILFTLCEKYPNLGGEIEFLLYPKSIKNPQSYYNKLVKRAIDTNSWSHFPNKGIKGLEEMSAQVFFFEKIGNEREAIKLATAILDIIARTRKRRNNQNVTELKEIKHKLSRFIA